MTYEQAILILRHGSAEGENKYFEAIDVIENEIANKDAIIGRLKYALVLSKTEIKRLSRRKKGGDG